MKVLVTGGTGFIGNWLVRRLKRDGHWVRCVDIEPPRYAEDESDEFLQLDLRSENNALVAAAGMDWIFHLAADMGGMGYLANAHAEMISNNSKININTLWAAKRFHIQRFLFASSACIYPCYLQEEESPRQLKETDAYPADPQGAYGWEKLHMEHLCKWYREASWVDTRIVRFHNCMGEKGAWRGGREKAPAALCRKIAMAKLSGNPEVEIWGSGMQKRSFFHVKDCVDGLLILMESDFPGPVNFGSDYAVSIDQMADIIAEIAEIKIVKKHIDGPVGVMARNSDNTLCKERLGWEPKISLQKGLESIYWWIEKQLRAEYESC